MARDVEYFGVDGDKLIPLEDVDSILELASGYYVVKPVESEGCWMDAVSFEILRSDENLWENRAVKEESNAT